MSSDFPDPLHFLREELIHPGDLLTVLMIIGADVIQRALAQLAGGSLTPVSFSFGWVAFSFNTLVLAVGDNKLLPPPDCPSIVVNGEHGHVRDNKSWVLGRVIRDFEYWMPDQVSELLGKIKADATEADRQAAIKKSGNPLIEVPIRERAGLCISIFRTSSNHHAGIPVNDWVYYSGIVVAVIQLIVAAIPWVLYNDWLIFMTSAVGIFLAFAYGALPQWRAEKWKCRRQAKTVILTLGNGAQHAIVIQGGKETLDLEDLAAGERSNSNSTRIFAVMMAFAWLVLLLIVSGIKEDPWFLLGVGGIGMIQNVIVAGASRKPSAFGIHLEFVECIGHRKVLEALMAVEELYPSVGASMVGVFFPGKLRAHEEEYWSKMEKVAVDKKKAKRELENRPQVSEKVDVVHQFTKREEV